MCQHLFHCEFRGRAGDLLATHEPSVFPSEYYCFANAPHFFSRDFFASEPRRCRMSQFSAAGDYWCMMLGHVRTGCQMLPHKWWALLCSSRDFYPVVL